MSTSGWCVFEDGDLADVVDARACVADEARRDRLRRADARSQMQLALVRRRHRLQVQVVRKQADVATGQLEPALHRADLQREVLQCEHRLHV